MLRVLLLVFALCFPTKSYLNYSAVLPLNSYRNNHLEKLPIPPNRLDEINSGSPFRRQHVEFQDKHPFNNERSIPLREHRGGRVPNLDPRINKNIANPLLFDGRFPPRPFYNLGPYNYGCLNCYHFCHLYSKGLLLLNSQFPLIVQKPRPTSSSSTAISFSSTTTKPSTNTTSPTTATPSTKTILLTTATPYTKKTSTTTTTPSTTTILSIATTSSTETIKPSTITESGISEST